MAKIYHGYRGHESFGDGSVGYFGDLTDADSPSGGLLRAAALCGFTLALVFKPELLGFHLLFGKPRRRRGR